MSFASITNDNKSGDETRLRLVIEGWPDYFTTDAAFGENAAAAFQITDGRNQIPGLLRDGIMIRYGAGDDYRLIFDRAAESGDNNVTDSQAKYVYVADEQLDLYDDASARLFS